MPLAMIGRFIAAFLVLLGTSGQGFASMVCGTPQCPKTLKVETKPVEPKHACCAKKKAKPEPEKSCCCKVESAKVTAKLDPKVTIPTGFHLDLTLPEPGIAVPATAKIEAASDIPSFTDPSPPDPADLPDRGRAPPAL